VVKTLRIIDHFVDHVHTVIVSIAAIVGLFIFPPAGIVLLLYLRGIMNNDRT